MGAPVAAGGSRLRWTERFLRRAIAKIDGSTWNDVADRIGRLAHWDYEDCGVAPDR